MNAYGTVDVDMSGNLAFDTPSFQSSLQVASDASLTVQLKQNIYWKIGFGFSQANIFAKFRTPVISQYAYEYELGGTCADTQVLALAAVRDAVGLSVGFQLTTSSALDYNTLLSSSSTDCFVSQSNDNPVPAPTPNPAPNNNPTPAPQGSGGGGGGGSCFTLNLHDTYGDGMCRSIIY